jgi:indolepyruvate decarboxylase
MSLLDGARYPVILAGVEVHRFGLADKLLRLVEKLDIPFATTIDGKSVLPEKHPLFIGIYMGALSRKEVREQLENSDGLLSIGSMTTDINSGGFTAHLPQHRMISAHKNRVRIGRHYYDRVWLGDYLDALSRALKPHNYTATHHIDPHGPGGEYQASPDAPVRVSRFYDRLNRFLGSEMILVAETGDAMFAASELYVNEPENFVSQAYYLSIGYALPAGCAWPVRTSAWYCCRETAPSR